MNGARRPAGTLCKTASGSCIGFFLAAALTTGCADPALLPEQPHAAERIVIHPYAAHEQCARLADGERLDYRYEASEPLHFEIEYREDNAVLAPLVRDASTSDSGIFRAPAAREYCAVWQAGAAGAMLSYRLLRHAAR